MNLKLLPKKSPLEHASNELHETQIKLLEMTSYAEYYQAMAEMLEQRAARLQQHIHQLSSKDTP